MNAPIRVLHVLTKLSFGGVQTIVMNYYKNIDRRKVQFDFVVQNEGEEFYEYEVKSLGGQIYRVAPLHLDRKKFEKDLMNILKSNAGYRIIHVHQNFLNIVPLRVAKKAGVQVRISHSHNNYKAISLYKRLQRFVFKAIIPLYATDYLSCSNASAEWLYGKKAARSSKCRVVHNAINTRKFLLDYEIRRRVREKLIINDRIVLIHVGMFTSAKNHEYLFEIVKQLVKLNKQIVLLLVGDGERKELLLEMVELKGIQEQVLFLGMQDNVQDLLMAADFFIFPSRYEGLPLTVIEAQVSGLKCIVSNVITPEVDLFNDILFLSIKNSPEVWAKNIIDNLGNRRARTFNDLAKTGYEISNEAKELQKLYERTSI